MRTSSKATDAAHHGSPSSGRIVLFGLFGIGNLGNDSTLWVLLHHLKRRRPGVELLCVTDSLPDFAAAYDVRHLPIDPIPARGLWRVRIEPLRKLLSLALGLLSEPARRRNARHLLGRGDEFLVVGTGALDDFGAGPAGMPTWIARWCSVARSAGAQVRLVAVGAGPISHPFSRYLMRSAVKAASFRTYRDEYSRDYMASLGAGSDDDPVIPDMVFAWPTQWMPQWRAPQSPPRVIGVGLMTYFGWDGAGEQGLRTYRQYIARMVGAIGSWLRDGYSVRLLVGEPRADIRAVRDVLDGLGADTVRQAGDHLIANDIDSVETLLREISMTDVVVATRYHNLIFALAAHRPVISLGYAPKFQQLMNAFGIAEYHQHVEDFDLEKLRGHLADVVRKHERLVRSIAERSMAYRRRLEDFFDDSFGPVQCGSSCEEPLASRPSLEEAR